METLLSLTESRKEERKTSDSVEKEERKTLDSMETEEPEIQEYEVKVLDRDTIDFVGAETTRYHKGREIQDQTIVLPTKRSVHNQLYHHVAECRAWCRLIAPEAADGNNEKAEQKLYSEVFGSLAQQQGQTEQQLSEFVKEAFTKARYALRAYLASAEDLQLQVDSYQELLRHYFLALWKQRLRLMSHLPSVHDNHVTLLRYTVMDVTYLAHYFIASYL